MQEGCLAETEFFLRFNSEVAIIQKPVHRFALQITIFQSLTVLVMK